MENLLADSRYVNRKSMRESLDSLASPVIFFVIFCYFVSKFIENLITKISLYTGFKIIVKIIGGFKIIPNFIV
uniref:Uncharacterized protein n=1 Tax=Meloidogyne enterolobii TaxID=390850 RepID=A0A6V7VV86_MELEN|nr:unnamed protein product [Meloidogyne enterolobii]